MNSKRETLLPLTAYLSAAEREEFARSLDAIWLDHLGPDRFAAYRRRFSPPAWLDRLPQLPPRDENGRLPSYT